jgi:hypothetical protein
VIRAARTARLAAAIAVASAIAAAAPATAQVSLGPITGKSLGGFVLPTEPGTWPVSLRSVSANVWKVDSTQRVYLSGRVSVQLGTYDFTAERAVLWIERLPTAKGLVTQLALWFPETIEPTKAAGLGAGGSNLFVTAATYGDVSLSAVLVEPTEPERNDDLLRAQQRLAAYLSELVANPPALRILPEVLRPPAPPPPPPLAVGDVAPADPSVAAAMEAASAPSAAPPMRELPAAQVAAPVAGEEIDRTSTRPIVAPDSTVVFAAEQLDVDADSDTVTLTKGASVDVLPRFEGGASRALQLRADRGVVFLRKGTVAGLKGGGTETSADSVLGVYLEGEVYATDFRYSVRARRAYYDFATNRASMVDGVLRTQDRRGIPLVARARELRQFSQQQFEATDVRVSMSEFFEPHLSVGAERATITQVEAADGGTEARLSARDVTFAAGTVPFFWLPSFEAAGELTPPIRRAAVNYNDQTGAQINTSWDLFSLLGIAPPPGSELDLVEEAFTNWGVGGGVRGTIAGARLDLLAIYDFRNEEQTSAGQFVTASDSFRGTFSGSRTFEFSDTAKLQLQGSYVTDESFMQTWRQREFATGPQRETSAYLVDAGDRSEISVLLSVPTNDVITNSSQLASRPYQVRKYPEVAYKRWGDTLFGDSLVWQQEYSGNLMAIEYGRGSSNSTGVRSNTFNLLGQQYAPGKTFTRDTTVEDLYGSEGYATDTISRLYTRQELSSTFGSGSAKVTPFASGSAYGYVDGNPGDYSEYADRFRAILAAGFRSSAELISSFDRFEVPTLDLHRMRHVLSPYVNTWAGWNTTEDLAYAIYDQEIEAATGGAAVQAGIKQRLQTMRGGPGNWQSVDWLTVDVGLVWNESGDDLARTFTDGAQYRQSPFPQYFAWRPELSQWGRNAYAAFTMAASSSLTFRGNLTYLLEDDLPDYGGGAFGLANAARGSIGASMQHSQDVSTFIEYRGINNFSPEDIYLSDALLAAGVNYRISKAYTASFIPTYDLREGDFRLFTTNIAREMPDFTLLGTFGYDAVQDQYFGGLNIRIGAGGSATPSLFNTAAIDR